MRLFTVVLLASLAGCFYTRKVGPDNTDPPDGGTTTDADAALPAGAITFRLTHRFEGGFAPADWCGSTYYQAAGVGGLQDFVSITDPQGGIIYTTPDCSPTACLCPSEPGDNNTTICDQATVPTVVQINVGQSADFVWSGTAWPFSCLQGNGQSCQAPAIPASGAYLASFCYSDTTTGVGPNQQIGLRTCSDVPFDYPNPGGVVEGFVTCVGP